MNSKKTYLLLAALLVVAVATYFLMQKGTQTTTLVGDETEFAVADTASIDKIFISTKSGRNSTLERRPGKPWLLDGKYEARPDMMRNLLLTINQIRVKKPVSKEGRNSVIKTLATEGTKVEIYQNGKRTKTYYLGGNPQDLLGTYYIMEGSETPYLVHIPGFDGFVDSRYKVDYMYWRHAPIFQSLPKDIQSIAVSYPKDPAGSFTVVNTGNRVEIPELADEDTMRVKKYLGFFGNVHAEFFVDDPDNRMLDSLQLLTPAAIVKLTDVNPAKNRVLNIYLRDDTPDRHYATLEKGKEVMSVQTYVFNKILLDKSAFSKKEAPIVEFQ